MENRESVGTVQRAAERGGEFAAEAKEQVGAIGEQVRSQSEDLTRSVKSQMDEQLGRGKEQLVMMLRQLGDEFDEVTPHASGTVADLTSQASNGARGLSDWLDERGPGEILRSVEDIARRRPMRFLLVSAAAGLVLGRVTRSLMSAESEHEEQGMAAPISPQIRAGAGDTVSGFRPESAYSGYPTRPGVAGGTEEREPGELELTGRISPTGLGETRP
jgi:hypothetical protein